MRMTIVRFGLAALLAMAGVAPALAALAAKQGAVVYEFEKTRDIAGVMVEGGKLFLVLGQSSRSGLNDDSTFQQIVAVGKLGGPGGSGCKTQTRTDIGIQWRINSCVQVTKTGPDTYRVELLAKYKFPAMNVKENIEFLKAEDFVQQRKQTLTFTLNGPACSGEVISRHYMALDGDTWVPSRTGPFACVVKN